jgi:hypothetical protein
VKAKRPEPLALIELTADTLINPYLKPVAPLEAKQQPDVVAPHMDNSQPPTGQTPVSKEAYVILFIVYVLLLLLLLLIYLPPKLFAFKLGGVTPPVDITEPPVGLLGQLVEVLTQWYHHLYKSWPGIYGAISYMQLALKDLIGWAMSLLSKGYGNMEGIMANVYNWIGVSYW